MCDITNLNCNIALLPLGKCSFPLPIIKQNLWDLRKLEIELLAAQASLLGQQLLNGIYFNGKLVPKGP